MAELKFNKDAVSENLRRLISMGIGTMTPSGQGSVPSFTNRDVQVHAQSIGRTLGPIGVQEPLGARTDGQGLDFKALDTPELQNIRDITIKIGELEGQQLENDAQLGFMLQTDPAVVSAQSLVSQLSNELAITTTPENKAEVQAELITATKLLDSAMDTGIQKAGIQQKTQNNIIQADIARLSARKQVLLDEQSRIDAGKIKEPVAPAIMSDFVMKVDLAKTPREADRVLNAMPKDQFDMILAQSTAVRQGRPIELWDPIFDAGGRDLAERYILESIPPTDVEATRLAINRVNQQMVNANAVAIKDVQLEVNEGQLPRDDDAIQRRQLEIRDSLMREATFLSFESRLLTLDGSELDPSWFAQGTPQLELAQQMVNLVNKDDPGGVASAYAAAANQLLRQGKGRNLINSTINGIMESQQSAWNNINKHVGAEVTRAKYQSMINTLGLKIFNSDRLAKQAEFAEQTQRVLVGNMQERERTRDAVIDPLTRLRSSINRGTP